MSEAKALLNLRSDGTALDPDTGLMWMIPFVGQGWRGGAPRGEAATYSWTEAASRFGKARNIAANGLDCHWGKRAHQCPLTRDSYIGYQPGSKKIDFAGHQDWRLPTVEEFWTLSLLDFAGTPLDVGQTDLERMQTWTANPSTKSLGGFFVALLDMGFCAWMFELYPSKDFSNGYGDMKIQFCYPVRLVRAGHIYQNTH